jgi:hypothetical protein
VESIKFTCPRDCPKFNKCNATICPLDKDWHLRGFLREDATCFYLLESVKEGAGTHFEGAQLGILYERILNVREEIASTHKRIGRKLISAAKSASRMTRSFKQQINVVKIVGD